MTSIGEDTFLRCTGLTSVKVDKDNPKYHSLENCKAIIETWSDKTIVACINKKAIPGVVITGSVLTCCENKKLRKIVIPEWVRYIENNAFEDCTNLTSIEIPRSVTSIRDKAFKNCTGLTSIEIPDSVTNIGKKAFEGCTGLTSIVIPSSVECIGSGVFKNCSSLTSIKVDKCNEYFDSREDCNAIIQTCNNTMLAACNKTTLIPSDVRKIGDYAFFGMTNLTSIEIPSSVTSIGRWAFSGCAGLTSLKVPDGVSSIGWCAFEGCSGLTSINIPNRLKFIPWGAFSECKGLASIKIPDSVTSIDMRAFFGCTGLTSVEIPDSMTSIKASTFRGCTGLTSIEIPESVTSIEVNAFAGCTGLISIVFRSSVRSIESGAFYGCKDIREIHLLQKSPFKWMTKSGAFNDFNECTLYVSEDCIGYYLNHDVYKHYFKEVKPEIITTTLSGMCQTPHTSTEIYTMKVAGHECQAVGDRSLLDNPDKVAVIACDNYTEEESARLWEEWLACGERGGVLVSAAIAPKRRRYSARP